ncbi:MAG: hypothetical protein FRX49_03367 [Trebouxia sp. A1-2]|nr:MAG: hypothetical protein FRX49_03367 [Trebouxia sp. A1-2]
MLVEEPDSGKLAPSCMRPKPCLVEGGGSKGTPFFVGSSSGASAATAAPVGYHPSTKYWRTNATAPATTGVDMLARQEQSDMLFVVQAGTHSSEYGEMVVPGAMISGLYRPSKVGPTEENSGRAVLAGMKADGMVMVTPDQPLSAVIFTKPSSSSLYMMAAAAPPFCALATYRQQDCHDNFVSFAPRQHHNLPRQGIGVAQGGAAISRHPGHKGVDSPSTDSSPQAIATTGVARIPYSRWESGLPTDRQFLDTEGEVTVESTSSYPKLPAANTGRKS